MSDRLKNSSPPRHTDGDGTRIRIGAPLGSGGMGQVRAAERVDHDGNVIDDKLAVKQLAVRLLTSELAKRRFRREVRAQRALKHPNIMPVVAYDLKASPPWYAMPRADGNLDDEIPRGGMSLADAQAALVQVLTGVAFAHDNDVVHRDLKPANVLRMGSALLISDFGLVKSLAADATHMTRTRQAMGTRPYMAPEQFDDPKNVGKPADVYATGKMMIKMCTGKEPPTRAVSLVGVPAELHYFIGRCCETDPARRYQDAGEALAALRALIDTDVDAEQAAQRLVDQAADALRDGTQGGAVSALAAYLVANADDRDMYLDVVARMPTRVITSLVDEEPTAFASVLAAYDDYVNASLDFAYCDTVASFYKKIWNATRDLAPRKTVLARLIELGAYHNRWAVRDVVCDLLESIKDKATTMMAAEVITTDAYHARWHAEEALRRKLAPAIARALRATLKD